MVSVGMVDCTSPFMIINQSVNRSVEFEERGSFTAIRGSSVIVLGGVEEERSGYKRREGNS